MVFGIVMSGHKEEKDASIVEAVGETSAGCVGSTPVLEGEEEAFKKENAVIRKQKGGRKGRGGRKPVRLIEIRRGEHMGS